MTDPNADGRAAAAMIEPPIALVTGAMLGGFTFLLCALLFGARVAIGIAVLFAIGAIVRRTAPAALLFAAAAAIAVGGLMMSTTALILASAAFGSALALFAQARLRAHVASPVRGTVDL